jgi:hypothetical protein
MSDEKRILIEDIGGDFGFRVRWAALDHWADFEVYEVVSVEQDGLCLKYFRAEGDGEELTPNISGADLYCHGHIKWDGCSHVHQEEAHLCGADAFKKHMALLRYLYLRAGELMNRPSGQLNQPWGVWDELPEMRPNK